MDRKTVKAGLMKYRHIDEEIRQKLLWAEEAGDTEDGRQYREEAERLKDTKQEMLHAMNGLPTVERDCIWRHYVNGEMWVRIARKHNYSERQIRNIANQGIDHLVMLVKRKDILRSYFLSTKRDFIH